MEGRVYLCGWERTEDGFRLWLRSNPRIRSKGATLNAATEALWSKVIGKYGDGEAQFEFLPSLPETTDCSQFVAKYVMLGCPDSYRGVARTAGDKLFDGVVCSECRMPDGRRSILPLRIEDRVHSADGIDIHYSYPNVSLNAFSENFISGLSSEVRNAIEWREVILPKGSRKKFFEAVVPIIAPQAAKVRVSYWTWNCPKCGKTPGVLASPSYLQLPRFVSEQDVPANTLAFAHYAPTNPHLCVRAEVWDELLAARKVRGVQSHSIYVLAKRDVGASEIFPLPLDTKIGKISHEIWEHERDRLLKSPPVLQMQSDPKISDSDVWDYIHAIVDDKTAYPAVYRAYRHELDA